MLDAADQSIFSAFDAEPADYQSYDKALDVYYLVIAYAATLRNWRDKLAFQVARFLWYYRLVGTVAFELTGADGLLLVFPNTFEYAVIAYEAVRVRWDPRRLPHRAVLGAAAAIWIGVKLPQEYWLHVAKLDVTDVLGAHPWLLVPLLAVLAGVGLLAVRVAPKLPTPDWDWSFDVDKHLEPSDVAAPKAAFVRGLPFWGAVVEKVVLLALVSITFGQVLPVRATGTQLAVVVVVFAVLNAALSQLFARRGTSWQTAGGQFLAMLAANGAVVAVLSLLPGSVDAEIQPGVTLFFVLLLSLLVTLYDRYRAMREHRLLAPSMPRGRPRVR